MLSSFLSSFLLIFSCSSSIDIYSNSEVFTLALLWLRWLNLRFLLSNRYRLYFGAQIFSFDCNGRFNSFLVLFYCFFNAFFYFFFRCWFKFVLNLLSRNNPIILFRNFILECLFDIKGYITFSLLWLNYRNQFSHSWSFWRFINEIDCSIFRLNLLNWRFSFWSLSYRLSITLSSVNSWGSIIFWSRCDWLMDNHSW